MREFAFANERRPDSGAVKEVRDATSDPQLLLIIRMAPEVHGPLIKGIVAFFGPLKIVNPLG